MKESMQGNDDNNNNKTAGPPTVCFWWLTFCRCRMSCSTSGDSFTLSALISTSTACLSGDSHVLTTRLTGSRMLTATDCRSAPAPSPAPLVAAAAAAAWASSNADVVEVAEAVAGESGSSWGEPPGVSREEEFSSKRAWALMHRLSSSARMCCVVGCTAARGGGRRVLSST
jgi:hypothetical protein